MEISLNTLDIAGYNILRTIFSYSEDKGVHKSDFRQCLSYCVKGVNSTQYGL